MGMNIFRFAGDMIHLLSFIILIRRLRRSKSAEGISLKTLELYLLVFVARYLDLFLPHSHSWLTLYLTIMKIAYIGLTGLLVHTVRTKEPWKSSYSAEEDALKHWQFCVAPSFALAFVLQAYDQGTPFVDVMMLLWTFSIVLESISIMPQLILLRRYKNVESLTGQYVFCLGVYRALYILNWIYRYQYEYHYGSHYFVWFFGVVQTAVYSDFLYLYVTSKGALTLPE